MARTVSALVALLLGMASGGCQSESSEPVDREPAELSSGCGHGAPSGCGPDQFCDEDPGLCGMGRAPGVCRERPEACAEHDGPICGCDRQVYESECAAHAAGVDVSVLGGCGEQVPGQIACGARYCDARSSYCEIILSDVLDLPSTYTCRPLPSGCGASSDSAQASTCGCLPDETRCSDFCVAVEAEGATSFRLTCVGGY